MKIPAETNSNYLFQTHLWEFDCLWDTSRNKKKQTIPVTDENSIFILISSFSSQNGWGPVENC